MEFSITFGVAFIILSVAIIYVTIKNISRNQKRNRELVKYKIEMDKLEERFRRKELSKDNYERLRKNLEEQYQKYQKTNRINF